MNNDNYIEKYYSIPVTILMAIRLLYLSLGIMLLSIFLSLTKQDAMLPYLIGNIIPLLLIFLFISKISKKKNWARITLIVLVIITIPFKGIGLISSLSNSLLDGLISLCMIALQIVAVVLLLKKSSAQWYTPENV